MKTVLRVCWMMVLIILGSGIARAQSLLLEPGVVIKFGPDAGLSLTGRLTVRDGAVLTSLEDDSTLGQTGIVAGSPEAGDWAGVRVESNSSVLVLQDRRMRIRYAEVGLDLLANRSLTGWFFEDNLIGMRLHGFSPNLDEVYFGGNQVGLELRNARPQILNSSFVGNNLAAIRNLTIEQAVPARRNWWGSATGPQDPFDNPNGTGDPVSRGVDYALWLGARPLSDCSVNLRASSYTVGGRNITLRLRCDGAVEARISENPGFPLVSYSPFVGPTEDRAFELSAGDGPKPLFVQYRGAQGQTRLVSPPQLIRLSEGGPSVGITSPDFGSAFVDDTVVPLAAQVTHDAPIALVRFMIQGIILGIDATEPYTATWNPATFANGQYWLIAEAVDINGQVGRGQIPVRMARPSTDVVPPVIGEFRFDDTVLNDGSTLGRSGTFTVAVTDVGDGLAGVSLSVDGFEQNLIRVSGGNLFVASVDLERFVNGPVRFQVQARDRAGNESSSFRDVVINLPIPPAPILTQPANGTILEQPQALVSGTAAARSSVQIQVLGQEETYFASANSSGGFNLRVPLIGEGVKRIVARASNLVGTSPASNELQLNVALPAPVVTITNPGTNGSIVSGDIELRAGVVDYRDGTEVEFFLDNVSLGKDTDPPYLMMYSAQGQAEGEKVLRVVARNAVAQGTAERRFVLRREPPPPLPFNPPYVGSGLTVTPTPSLGTAPIRISGRIREANLPDSVPNAALVLVLRQGDFQRRINTVADAEGNFAFDFLPQDRDAGDFSVVAVHPRAVPFQNTGPTGLASFTINRLIPGQARYQVPVPIGFGEDFSVSVRASAGSGATQVRLVAVAEDQPSGVLPVGISFEGGPGQDLAAGNTGTFPVRLVSTAAPNLPRRGSLFVRVVSTEGGASARARFRVDFERFPAQPLLVPRPVSVATGVRRGEVLLESLRLENRGLTAATGVNLTLEGRPGGGPVPSWLSLLTASPIESIAAGGQATVELRAAPPASVPDGLYEAQLRVQSAGGVSGVVAVSVAVAQAGEARVRFTTADLFTDTGTPPQQGVAGARFVLQSESNPQLRLTGTTDDIGTVLLGPVPPGRYQYRVTSPNHAPASGRVILRAGAVVQERVFLDFETVSFTWSVSPTTIPDRYLVNLSATFQTEVPAPVVLITPTSINIPEMQVGEELTGELTITNHGLLRADDVVLTPSAADPYFRLEIDTAIPNTLEARQSVRLPYRLVKLQSLPPEVERQSALRAWLTGTDGARTTSSCSVYRKSVLLSFGYLCAAGDVRRGSASASFTAAYGSTCGSTSIPTPIGSGGGGGWGGAPGIPGGFAGPLGDQCAPDCTEGCVCGTVGGCGGGGGGGGGDLGDGLPPGVPPQTPPTVPPSSCKAE